MSALEPLHTAGMVGTEKHVLERKISKQIQQSIMQVLASLGNILQRIGRNTYKTYFLTNLTN